MQVFRDTFARLADFDELKMIGTVDVMIGGERRNVCCQVFKHELDAQMKPLPTTCLSIGDGQFRTNEYRYVSVFSRDETTIEATAVKDGYHRVAVEAVMFKD